jgi:hypothetical protein
MEILFKYLPQSPEIMLSSPQGAAMYKIWDARNLILDRKSTSKGKYCTTDSETTTLVRSNNAIRFMVLQRFDTIARALGVILKKTNTIVEPWPTALKLQPTQIGAQEEFELLLASNFSGLERYVEWKRAD